MTIRVTAIDSGFDFEPILSPTIDITQTVRSSVLQPLGLGAPYVTLRPADTRSGQFEFLLATAADALTAVNILIAGVVFHYLNDDVPTAVEEFDFVVVDQVQRVRNMPFRSWTVRCGFRETQGSI